jgi:hypothetical protein
LRICSFIGLAHFFVTFVHRRQASDCQTEHSMISAVANMFDKHVFHWLRMTWEQFEQTKSMHGLVIVSSLVKEMISFIETVVLHGSHADKFAYEALVSEILWSETNDDYLHFLKTAVKRYDSNNAPLIYLANVVEGMHAASGLLETVSTSKVTRGKEFYDDIMVNNHVRLLAFRHLNPQALNRKLLLFVEEVIQNGMERALYEFNNLEIMYSIATEHSAEAPSGLFGIKRVTSVVIEGFMKHFYSMSVDDAQRNGSIKYFVDPVFTS